MPLTLTARLRAVLAELPWLVGIGVGAWTLVIRGAGLRTLFTGLDWEFYLSAAEAVADPGRPGVSLSAWRGVLYPWLVAMLGEHGTYVDAARLVSLGAAILTVAAGGLAVRALANPWAGGVAAVAAAGFFPLVRSSGWLNPYSLQAATLGMTLALGACACRWPGVLCAGAAGWMAGLATHADPRGWLAPPIALGLVLLGAAAKGVPWIRRVGMVLAFVAVTGLAVSAGDRLRAPHGPASPVSELLVKHQATMPGLDGAGVRQACVGFPKGPPPSYRSIGTPCAAAYLAENLDTLRTGDGFVPAGTLWLGLLLLLPGRWGRRSVPASLAIAGLPLLATFYSMCLIQVWDRYLAWLAVSVGVLVPVGFARVADLLPRWRVLPAVAALAALAWTLWIWPGTGQALPPPPLPDQRADIVTWARASLRPEDPILDCGDVYLRQLLLPLRFDLQAARPDSPTCTAWIARPTVAGGSRYLLLYRDRRKWAPGIDALWRWGWEEVPLPPARTTEGRMVFRKTGSAE